MLLEQQVTSLELSSRLKELGVKQDSIYYWTWVEWNGKTEWVLIPRDRAIKLKKEKYSAFTVAELGEALPDGYYTLRQARVRRRENTDWSVWMCVHVSNLQNVKRAKTEADTRAKMLIYLIENKLVEVEAK